MALNLPVNALAGNSKNLKIAAPRLAACIIGPCSGPGGEYALLHARMPWQPYMGDAHVCSCSASLSLYYYKNHARYAPPAGFACGYIYYSGHLCTWQPACTNFNEVRTLGCARRMPVPGPRAAARGHMRMFYFEVHAACFMIAYMCVQRARQPGPGSYTCRRPCMHVKLPRPGGCMWRYACAVAAMARHQCRIMMRMMAGPW